MIVVLPGLVSSVNAEKLSELAVRSLSGVSAVLDLKKLAEAELVHSIAKLQSFESDFLSEGVKLSAWKLMLESGFVMPPSGEKSAEFKLDVSFT